MATLLATPLTATIMTISSTVFLSPLNAALAALFLTAWQTGLFADLLGPVPLRVTLWAASSISTLAFLLFQFLRMKGAKDKAPQWNGLGKVLLFPCSTTHTRFFPKKHSFSYPYLLVGIPVGFEGNAGGMVSVKPKGKPGFFSITPWASWFTVDAGDYLGRGKSELGLRGKLDEYLQTQGVDPAIYPHTYLITAPRFLGYQFNPVSFWYLYDADERLSAMILEVNNTFSERRMYFLTAEHGPAGLPSASNEAAEGGARSPAHRIPQRTFKQTFPKDFHVSPFNPRNGSYTLTTSDPLQHPPKGVAPGLRTTLTLLTSQNHPKMTATLTSLPSSTPALNPCALTPTQKLSLLLAWCPTPLLTYPRILAQAAVLYLRHKLPIWERPEPCRGTGTLSRVATRGEGWLEGVFRGYLRRLVERGGWGLVVRYTAAGVLLEEDGGGGTEVFCSPGGKGVGERVEVLEVVVLTPAFYARFATRYTGTLEALVGEGKEGGTVWVSRPDLLARLVPPGEKTTATGLLELLGLRDTNTHKTGLGETTGPGGDLLFRGLQYLRGGMSEMDAYVLECEGWRERERYKGYVLRLLLAEMLPFGGVALVEGVWLMAQVGFAVLFLYAVASAMRRW